MRSQPEAVSQAKFPYRQETTCNSLTDKAVGENKHDFYYFVSNKRTLDLGGVCIYWLIFT